MMAIRTVAVATTLATVLVTGCAQIPGGHDTHPSEAASTGKMSMPMGSSDAHMARMDEQMKAMQTMHDKLMEARTPEERSAMMAEHMEVMQDSMKVMHGSMAMMGEMGSGGMMEKGDMKGKAAMSADKGGMADMQHKDRMHGDMDQHHQMMEKRMQMMQSMMKMMMDRMPEASDKN